MREIVSIALVFATACAGAPTRSRPTAPSCVFDGAWTGLDMLRDASGTFEVVWLLEPTAGRGTLVGSGDDLHVALEVEHDGWSLRGRLNAREDWSLSVREGVELRDGIEVPPGSLVRVLDVREGEVLVSFLPEENDEGTYRRWVPCAALEPASESQGDVLHMMTGGVEIGWLPPTRRIWISLEPGGAGFFQLPSEPLAMPVAVRERRADHVRIAVPLWSGANVIGWVRSSELLPHEADAEPADLPVAPAARAPREVCTSQEPLVLFAQGTMRYPPFLYEIGRIAPGTRFVVYDRTVDDMSVSPTDAVPFGPALMVRWRVRPSMPLECEIR